MTYKQRNVLLAEMTDEVAALVIRNNYKQTQSISISSSRAYDLLDLHNRYIRDISRKGLINPELEFLPTESELLERKANLKGLTGPEMAILFAYCKTILNQAILDSDVPEDPYLSSALVLAFPNPLREAYHEQMTQHRLAREIIATLLSNAVVNEMGFTFMHQLNNETGAPISAIVRAYTITRNIYKLPEILTKIENLDYKIPAKTQQDMLFIVSKLVRRATRWILRNRRTHLDITSTCEHFGPSIELLISKLENVLVGSEKEKFLEIKEQHLQAGVSEEIANYVAGDRAMISSLDIIDAAQIYGFDLEEVAATYFNLGEHLELGWFRAAINLHPVDNEWDTLAKEACRDDLDWQQRGLTIAILQSSLSSVTIEEKIETWIQKHGSLIERWKNMLNNLRSSSTTNFVMFSVAVRELMDLTQASFYAVQSIANANSMKKKKVKETKDTSAKTNIQKS